MSAGGAPDTPNRPPKLPPGRSPRPQRVELSNVGARTLIFVCHGPSCTERGSPEVCRVLRERIAVAPPEMRRALRVCETTCLDSCATGPNVVLGHDQRLRTGLTLGEIDRFLEFVTGGSATAAPVAMPSTPALADRPEPRTPGAGPDA